MPVAASYYDGLSARRHAVTLDIEDGQLGISGEAVQFTLPVDQCDIQGKLGSTPRLILLAGGARCEITDHAAFEDMLRAAGIAPSLLGRLETRWHHAWAALVITLAMVALAYFQGLPYAAEKIAYRVPGHVLEMMDRHFMDTFDGRLFEPTQLSSERQQVLAGRLSRMRVPGDAARPTQVLFRSSPAIGPNAFALPGGTIVLLDELVELADGDDEILAVLAHEMGHVAERHALRQTLQASAVGLAMAWYVGDISTVLAAAPATLLESRYSRNFERRADAFGADMLTLNRIAPARLADILEKLEDAHRKTAGQDKMDKDGHALDYFSTHPNTLERIRSLRAER